MLIVSAKLPGPLLTDRLRALGVNPKRLFVLDAVGNPMDSAQGHDRRHFAFVPSPNALELMVARARAAIRKLAEGHPHIILHDVDSLALYNPPAALEEAFQYVENTRVSPTATIDYIVADSLRLDRRLLEFLRAHVDAEMHLGQLDETHAPPSRTETPHGQ